MAQDNSKDKKTTILVTGANKGIGLAFAQMCLKDHNNLNLIVGCRSLGRVVGFDTKKSQNDLNKDPEFSICLLALFMIPYNVIQFVTCCCVWKS